MALTPSSVADFAESRRGTDAKPSGVACLHELARGAKEEGEANIAEGNLPLLIHNRRSLVATLARDDTLARVFCLGAGPRRCYALTRRVAKNLLLHVAAAGRLVILSLPAAFSKLPLRGFLRC